MFEPRVLTQLGTVLKSMAHIRSTAHMEVWSLGHNLLPCWGLWPMMEPGLFTVLPSGAMVSSTPRPLSGGMSGSAVWLKLGSALLSVDCVTLGDMRVMHDVGPC